MNSRVVAAIFLFVVSRTFAIEPLEEKVVQQYDVDATATVSVENLDGSIRVYAWERPVVIVYATKKAYTKERLQGIVIDTKATPSSVAITTALPPRRNVVSDRSGTVDYVIVVPQTARITNLMLVNGELVVEGLRGGSAKAHLVNGWLCGHNCFANLELSLDAGRIDLAYDWWVDDKFSVNAGSTRGNVRAILPSDISARLTARAVEGRITDAFDEKKPASGNVTHFLSAEFGPGEAAIALDALRGNVRIEKVY